MNGIWCDHIQLVFIWLWTSREDLAKPLRQTLPDFLNGRVRSLAIDDAPQSLFGDSSNEDPISWVDDPLDIGQLDLIKVDKCLV